MNFADMTLLHAYSLMSYLPLNIKDHCTIQNCLFFGNFYCTEVSHHGTVIN